MAIAESAITFIIVLIVGCFLIVAPFLGFFEEWKGVRKGKPRSRLRAGDALWMLGGFGLGVYLLTLLF